MPQMDIILNGDGAFAKETGTITVADPTKPVKVAVLDRGMQSGAPSVSIFVTLPDGTHVIAETSAKLFCSAARAFMAKYPHLLD